MSRLRPALALALLAPTIGCELFESLLPEGSATLPPFEALLVPKPSDTGADNTQEQAVCEDGNDAVVALEARVDALNTDLAADIALLRSLYTATPIVVGNVVTYEVESGGRSLSVQLVRSDEGEVAISATREDQIGNYIAGAYQEDGGKGAITINAGEESISSVWDTEGGEVKIARNQAEANLAIQVTDSRVRLAITAGADVVAAVWDRSNGEGAAVVGTEAAACWSGGSNVSEMCNEFCRPEVIADLDFIND
jgi:hypothetical protein